MTLQLIDVDQIMFWACLTCACINFLRSFLFKGELEQIRFMAIYAENYRGHVNTFLHLSNNFLAALLCKLQKIFNKILRIYLLREKLNFWQRQ